VSAALSRPGRNSRRSGLEAAFAEIFAARLDTAPLTPAARALAFRMSLLTGDFLIAAARHAPADEEETFLAAVALGRADQATPPGALAGRHRGGFAATEMPDRFGMARGRGTRRGAPAGAALFTSGAKGNYNDLRDAVAILRMLGFETVARRAALELLILAEPA
jgi:hypothetical protein